MLLSTESELLEGLGGSAEVAGGGGGRGGGTAGVGGGKITEKSPGGMARGGGGSGSVANCSAAFFIRSSSLIELRVLVFVSFIFTGCSPSEFFSLNLVEVAPFPKGENLSDF